MTEEVVIYLALQRAMLRAFWEAVRKAEMAEKQERLGRMKGLQLQFGITVKDKSVDIIVDNEGLHLHYDNLGDVSKDDS